VPYLLSPTHEEEITSLVARTVKSHKELPLRLYQITRKYRDEFRPRHGLLRGREFTMKDLYTFDISLTCALQTYDQVGRAYSEIFRCLGLPVLAAKASSGDMGGDLSHEYLLPTPLGEDRVASCSSCDYVVNEEIADTAAVIETPENKNTPIGVWRGITKDRSTLVNVWYPRSSGDAREEDEYTDSDINIFAVKSLVPDLDAGVEDTVSMWAAAMTGPTRSAAKLLNIVDGRLPASFLEELNTDNPKAAVWPEGSEFHGRSLPVSVHHRGDKDDRSLNLLRIRTGDKCPQCTSGSLKVEKALELGHTFHLGTRYSDPLEASVTVPSAASTVPAAANSGRSGRPNQLRETSAGLGQSVPVPMQMGCHGIGISRVVGAVAEHLADEKGLNWPVSIAPYSCVVIPGRDVSDEDVLEVYRDLHDSEKATPTAVHLDLDVVIDDRQKSLGWKLTDADLVGFPVIVVLGREWLSSRRAEVQCRRLGIKDLVHIANLPRVVNELHMSL